MFAVSQHRPKSLLAAAIAALALGACASPALARYDAPAPHGSDVAAPVNARGTDVAALDQQSPAIIVNARGTDVAAPDQQSPTDVGGGRVRPVDPVPGDDSLPTVTLIALIAAGLGGLGFAAHAAAGRRRTRATA
jgi:hypothetical protein